MTKGVILGIHKNSPKYHFVVLGFIRGNEYPRVDPASIVREHEKTRGYSAVWFQETIVPEIVDPILDAIAEAGLTVAFDIPAREPAVEPIGDDREGLGPWTGGTTPYHERGPISDDDDDIQSLMDRDRE